MRKILLSLLINGICIYAVTSLLGDNVVAVGGIKLYLLAALVVGLLNLLVKPLLKIISFPFIFITGGLFLIIINALILRILVYVLGVINFESIQFEIIGLKGYLYAAIIFGLTNWLQHWIFKLRS